MTVSTNATPKTIPIRPLAQTPYGMTIGASLLALAVAGMALASAGAASAQNRDGVRELAGGPGFGRGMSMERMFGELDTNDDDVVSAEELSAKRAEDFASFDADGDGQLSVTEIAQAIEEAREQRRRMASLRGVSRISAFADADANGDGTLSAEEFAAFRSPMLERVDANDDGDISLEEAEEFRDQMRERRGGWRHRRGG